MLFKIILELQEDIVGHEALTICGGAYGYYKACYGYYSISKADEILELYYFAFTTLSTVGFGDFHPMSNTERLFIAFGMLFGVAIFSVVMGDFVTMIGVIQDFNEDYNEGEKLARFFGVLKAFNRGQMIKQDLKEKIEKYFDHRWINNKNYFLSSDDYEEFFG